jgi:hypothetical protein
MLFLKKFTNISNNITEESKVAKFRLYFIYYSEVKEVEKFSTLSRDDLLTSCLFIPKQNFFAHLLHC